MLEQIVIAIVIDNQKLCGNWQKNSRFQILAMFFGLRKGEVFIVVALSLTSSFYVWRPIVESSKKSQELQSANDSQPNLTEATESPTN